MLVKKIGQNTYRKAKWWEYFVYWGKKKAWEIYLYGSCVVGATIILYTILIILGGK